MLWRLETSILLALLLLQQVAAFCIIRNDSSMAYEYSSKTYSYYTHREYVGANANTSNHGVILFAQKNEDSNGSESTRIIDSYETSDMSSKGFVSSLTGIVNLFMNDGGKKKDAENDDNLSPPPPQSPSELMEKIRDDYVEKNYLWTGDIYLPAFEPECTFTDPTLSFVGTDKFVSNVKNLVPIVDFLKGQDGTNKSDLLDIQINEEKGYVETRWNMVGDLNALPWKPAIDVIGRTKFWYREVEETNSNENNRKKDNGYRVYFYDEAWELEATTALLQLVTPRGRIPNSNIVET